MQTQGMLNRPVSVLPGVGEKKAKVLKGLGLVTVRDVLFSFPRTYKDFQRVLRPEEVQPGETQLVQGPLLHLSERPISQGRRLVQATLGGQLGLTWFVYHRAVGPSFLCRKLQKAKQVWVYGLVKEGTLFPEMTSPEVYTSPPEHQGLMPVYPLVSGITNNQRVNWARAALRFVGELRECLPPELCTSYMDRQEAIRQIHFPADLPSYERARERLAFEELFLFHLGLQRGQRQRAGIAHAPDGELASRFLARLPFELTDDQKAALLQVKEDMESPRPMRRLIQGEVGSGKTIVAEYGAVKAAASGGQVAMMVPTEVLAQQMAERFKASLGPLGIRVELLSGNMKTKEQDGVRRALAAGEVDVVVGTHALITDKVEYRNLTLAIVDEQHRFGVRQRAALLGKGNPDLLVMSATPIPRSLALTIYGDLDITEIRQLPAHRQPVDTRLIHPNRRADVYRYVLSRVQQGEQAYVVFPLVEESEHVDLKAAVQEMEELRKGLLAEARVGLIHGQMGREKEEVFQAFARGELDVLIATTVVEVGMNVPNATVMVIENAERFGLAQLHQLRGRVGRGKKPGICFLLAYSNSPQARARLEVVRRSNDGFFIAEEDLRLRGPGDLLGVRQWGQPLFRLADLQRDRELLQAAAEAVRELLSRDALLAGYPELAAELDHFPI